MIDVTIELTDKHFSCKDYNQLGHLLNAATSIHFEKNFVMNDNQLQTFLNYRYHSLIDLNLEGQNVNDDFIESLVESENLRRIKRINFGKNSNITEKTLDLLLESSLTSCEGYYVAISGKYGLPIMTIEIKLDNESIDYKKYKEPIFTHEFTDLSDESKHEHVIKQLALY
jgi:hypothetical protein